MSITAVIVFDSQKQPDDPEADEEAQQKAKLLFAWPSSLEGVRAGVCETLLQLTSRFLSSPLQHKTSSSPQDDIISSDFSGISTAPFIKKVPLTIQTKERVIAVEAQTENLIVAIACQSFRSSKRRNDGPPESTENNNNSSSSLIALRLPFKIKMGSKTSSQNNENNVSHQLYQNETGTEDDIDELTLIHGDLTLEILRRYCRHFEFLHGPIEALQNRSDGSTSSYDLINALSDFTEKFLVIEQHQSIYDLHSQVLGGLNGIQYAPLDRVGFLETRSFLHILETSELIKNGTTTLLGCALFFKGYYLGGTIKKEDIAIIYEYLISLPDGRVSNTKLLRPPWDKIRPKKAENTNTTMNSSHASTSLYGQVHSLNTNTTDTETSTTGYLLGPHPWFASPSTPSSNSSSPTQSHFLAPYVHLPSGGRALLVAFIHEAILCVLLFDKLGYQKAICTSEEPPLLNYNSSNQPMSSYFGYNYQVVDPPTLQWFDLLTKSILGRHDSKTAGLARLATAVTSHFDKIMSIEASNRFVYTNSVNGAFRRSNNVSNLSLRSKKSRKATFKTFSKFFTDRATTLNLDPFEGDLAKTPAFTVQETNWICESKSIINSSSIFSNESQELRSLKIDESTLETNRLSNDCIQKKSGKNQSYEGAQDTYHVTAKESLRSRDEGLKTAKKEQVIVTKTSDMRSGNADSMNEMDHDNIDESSVHSKLTSVIRAHNNETARTNEKQMTLNAKLLRDRLAKHRSQIKSEQVLRVAVKAADSGWIVGKQSLDRTYFIVSDELKGVSITDVLNGEEQFVDATFQHIFI